MGRAGSVSLLSCSPMYSATVNQSSEDIMSIAPPAIIRIPDTTDNEPESTINLKFVLDIIIVSLFLALGLTRKRMTYAARAIPQATRPPMIRLRLSEPTRSATEEKNAYYYYWC